MSELLVGVGIGCLVGAIVVILWIMWYLRRLWQ